MAKKVTNGRGFYRTYQFRDHDPIIDLVRTSVADSELSKAEINRQSGVSTTSLHNWLSGKTRRPQFCTVAAVLGSTGIHSIDLRSLRKAGKGT